MNNNNTIKTNSLKAWIYAARPKTLTGALIPVMLGTALAFYDSKFNYTSAILCALFACFMQIAANFINDLYDFIKGTDRDDRLGPERACAKSWISPRNMRLGIVLVIAVACVFGLTAVLLKWEILPYYGFEFIIIGIACIIFAILYTTIFSYIGLGDILVLVFFGLVPVCGTYYLQTQQINTNVILLSLISGISIDSLLIINNYRDREQDKLSGKHTIVVLLGETFGSYLYLAVCVLVDILIFILFIRDIINFEGLLVTIIVYSVLYFITWSKMVRIHYGKGLNRILGETSRNMFILAILLSISIINNYYI